MEIDGVFKVFVGNISDDVEIETIRSEFQQFGDVADISFDIASGKFSISKFLAPKIEFLTCSWL